MSKIVISGFGKEEFEFECYGLMNGENGSITGAIVHRDDGTVSCVPLGNIKFIKKSSVPEQTSLDIEEPKLTEVENLVMFWNSKSCLVRCAKTTDNIKKEYIKAIKKNGGKIVLKQAVENYATIMSDKKYWFNYKWNLLAFLKQGNCIPDFHNGGAKWLNYKSNKIVADEQLETSTSRNFKG